MMSEMPSFDTTDLAKLVKTSEQLMRRWLRKKWREGVLLHNKSSRWEFTEQEYRLVAYIYFLEKGWQGGRVDYSN